MSTPDENRIQRLENEADELTSRNDDVSQRQSDQLEHQIDSTSVDEMDTAYGTEDEQEEQEGRSIDRDLEAVREALDDARNIGTPQQRRDEMLEKAEADLADLSRRIDERRDPGEEDD